MVVFLALGSNLGDRERMLRNAILLMNQRGISFVRSASIYETEPRDYAQQPWFLNTVVEMATDLSPVELLKQCLEVEQVAGRLRSIPKGPRSLDIDIIFYDSVVLDTPGLMIPHPRYADRRFVLTPLAEIAPEFVDPRNGAPVKEIANACADPSVVKVYGPPLL